MSDTPAPDYARVQPGTENYRFIENCKKWNVPVCDSADHNAVEHTCSNPNCPMLEKKP